MGDTTFSAWKGVSYVRTRVIPANPQTDAQTKQRNALAHGVNAWQSIKSWAKDAWSVFTEGRALSSYNGYMSWNIELWADNLGADGSWAASASATLCAPYNEAYAALTGASADTGGGSGEIDITWTARAAADANNEVRILYRVGDSDIWTEDSDVAESAETATISGLTAGDEYEVAAVPFESSGPTNVYGKSFQSIVDAGA